MMDVAANPSEVVELALNHFGDDILRLAFSYLKRREDAEDVVQDTLIRLMRSGGEFETEEKLKAWLLHVAANLCKDILKSSVWKKQASLPEGYDVAVEDDSLTEGESDVWEAVMTLPDKYRSVVHLYYYEDYSTKEIAQILEKRESSVRTLLKRGREKIKQYLEKGEDGCEQGV